MKRLVAQFFEATPEVNSRSINIPADRMEILGDFILAWRGEDMVGCFTANSLERAYISEKENGK